MRYALTLTRSLVLVQVSLRRGIYRLVSTWRVLGMSLEMLGFVGCNRVVLREMLVRVLSRRICVLIRQLRRWASLNWRRAS